MSAESKLQELYKAIPTFSCKPGCSDCCGPVPFAKPEWEKVKLAKRVAGQDCLTCDYLVDGACSIYQGRPFLCRLFGATRDSKMACPHGCGPDKPLSAKQTEILTEKYRKLMGKEPAQMSVTIQAINVLNM